MLLHKNPGWGGNDLITITTSQSPTPFRFGVCAHFESSVELGPVRLKSTTQFLQFLILGLHGLYVFRVLDPLVRRTRSRREGNYKTETQASKVLGSRKKLSRTSSAISSKLLLHFSYRIFHINDSFSS